MTLNPWLMLVIGLVLGWLITWLIGRNGRKKLQAEVAGLNARLQSSTAELAQTKDQVASVQASAAAEAQRLNADVKARTADLEAARQQLAAAQAGESDAAARSQQIDLELQTRKADLAAVSDKLTAAEGSAAARMAELEAGLQACAAEREALRQQLAAAQQETTTRIGVFEAAVAASAAELAAVPSRRQELEAQVAEQSSAMQAEDAALGAVEDVAERAIAIDLAATAAGEEAEQEIPEIDDLTQIRGIGPAFAARLNAAGIRRYADLAAADPDEIVKSLGLKEWQQVDTSAWIAQADALAQRPRQVQIGDDLTRLEGIGPTYAQRLRAAGITTFAQLAATEEDTLDSVIGAPAWRQPNFGDWTAQAELAAVGDEAGLTALQDVLFSRKGDNLALIDGLGDTGVEALKSGGITSFAALAQATPEQLGDLFDKAGVRSGNFEGWIAEARLRAAGRRVARPASGLRSRSAALQGAQLRSCPQDLEQIHGVGRVYEQRLYAVGIGTFWEVGMVAQDELKTILEIREFQDVDLDAIQADALRLARETDAMGQTWDGSEPDDFDELEGIGAVLERRLYAAGICTYEDLATATRARLVEICKAPTFNQPDYDHWIEAAKTRVRARNA